MSRLRIFLLNAVIFLALLAVAGVLAFLIAPALAVGSAAPASSTDVVTRILGSAKEGIGDVLFLKADAYFHGGTRERFVDTSEMMHEEGPIEDDHGKPEAPKDWIEAMNRQITVHEHYHLAGEKKKEILPFLAGAVELDPYNLEAILGSAYWLSIQLDEPDEAVKVLEKGITNNPDAWELRSALGEIYFKKKKNWVKSVFYFRTALQKIGDKAAPFEAGTMAYYLAESYRCQGMKAEALKTYRASLKYYAGKEEPGIRKIILDRIKELS